MYASAAPLFRKDGCKMIAFSTGKDIGNFYEQFEEAGIQVYHRPVQFSAFSGNGVRYYISFFRFLKQEEVNILHIHRSDLYFAAVVARIAGVKCVKTQHSMFRNRWFTRPYAICQRFLVRNIFGVRFQTIGKSVYENELNYYRNPSVQINNWYNSTRFSPLHLRHDRSSLRKELQLPVDAFIVISTGSCTDVKRHEHVLKAMHLLKDHPDICYVHLGTGLNECAEQKLAAELGIADRVYFLGNRHNVEQYLRVSDAFVMTSQYEGLGNAAIEAMACGVPVILYDVPGLRDLVRESDNGFLIPADYHALSEKIMFLKENDNEAEKVGMAGADHVAAHYSMEKAVCKILSLYDMRKKLEYAVNH